MPSLHIDVVLLVSSEESRSGPKTLTLGATVKLL